MDDHKTTTGTDEFTGATFSYCENCSWTAFGVELEAARLAHQTSPDVYDEYTGPGWYDPWTMDEPDD